MRKGMIFPVVLVLFVFVFSAIGLGEGESCTFDANCTSGETCDQGICTSPADSCGDGTCDSNETYDTCSDDCQESCGSITCALGDWCADPFQEICCPPDKIGICEYTGECVNLEDECIRGESYCVLDSSITQPCICDGAERTSGNCCSDDTWSNTTCPDIVLDVCQGAVCDDDKCSRDLDGSICGNECDSDCPTPEPRKWCGDGICDSGEETWCYADCEGAGACGDGICQPGETCPEDCGYPEPPEFDVPEGCWEEFDQYTGTTRVTCQRRLECPSNQDIEYEMEKCARGGGKGEIKTDRNGCDFLDCKFGGEIHCPSPEEIETQMKKCEEYGGFVTITYTGGGFGGEGCDYIECKHEERYRYSMMCPEEENPGVSKRIRLMCEEQGIPIVIDFDSEGCAVTRCGQVGECVEDVPDNAYERCEGELIVKTNEEGCIEKVSCLSKGDSSRVRFEYDEIRNIPDVTELLVLALKLENIKIKFIELSEKLEAVASFYDTRDEAEAARFRKASDMLLAAGEMIDGIRTKMRELATQDHMFKEDLIELKRDIKYMKEVIIKDILFVMLGDADTVIEEYVEGKDCEDDKICFEFAFRTCTPVTFSSSSGGTAKQKVSVKGVEGNKCVLYMEISTDELSEFIIDTLAKRPDLTIETNPDGSYKLDMTCKFSDYHKGLPEVNSSKELLDLYENYCEGIMVELTKEFAAGPGGGEVAVIRSVPAREIERSSMSPDDRCGSSETMGEAKANCPIGTLPACYRIGGDASWRCTSEERNEIFITCGDGICEEWEVNACPGDCEGQ